VEYQINSVQIDAYLQENGNVKVYEAKGFSIMLEWSQLKHRFASFPQAAKQQAQPVKAMAVQVQAVDLVPVEAVVDRADSNRIETLTHWKSRFLWSHNTGLRPQLTLNQGFGGLITLV
jgi:hypothetical protein